MLNRLFGLRENNIFLNYGECETFNFVPSNTRFVLKNNNYGMFYKVVLIINHINCTFFVPEEFPKFCSYNIFLLQFLFW